MMSERQETRKDLTAMAAQKQQRYAESRREWAANYWKQVAASGQANRGLRATEVEGTRERRSQTMG